MAVYPFYVEVNSSTRKDKVGIGARSKNSYMETHIYQRDGGSITNPYRIVQNTFENTETGEIYLVTSIYKGNECIDTHETKY